MRNYELKTDQYLVSFLSTQDKKIIQQHFKEMEKTVETKLIANLLTNEGLV